MSALDQTTKISLKPLSKSNVVVTGGSRDIGGGIVLELAKAGANVISVFRSKPERAQRIVDEVKGAGGKAPLLLQSDLTTIEGREVVFKSWKDNFNNEIDVLVLCASGATMEINVDANMALVNKFLEIRNERLKNGEKLSPGTIIFLQSEPGHYHRVINGVFDFIEYYRDKVGPAKRAGEDAFKKRFPQMKEAGIRGIVVCPPEVTDTFNMKLFELQNKEARTKSRELSAMLGTTAFVTIAEVAKTVKEIIENENSQNGSIKLFGGNIQDGLTVLNTIYGEEAIYVHTYEKIAENKGIGRIIVNPKLWKRNEELSFVGEIKGEGIKKEDEIITSLKVLKEHMPGHFRADIASLFPGHKSIRTASVALGRFFGKDGSVDQDKIFLRKYKSVKFRNTVLPGQTLTTKVVVQNIVPLQTGKTKNMVMGDAIQTVNDKESMDIRGMVVEKLIVGANSNSPVLLLDQLVEAAAQAVGMHLLVGVKDDSPVLPLFHSTGEAEIFLDAKPGDNLLLKTENAKIIKMGPMNIFSADVEVVRGDEKIAVIKGLNGVILPKEEVLKKLK